MSFHAQVEPGFLLGFLESSIASLERSTDEDVNGIISRVELIERLRVKRTQASVSAKILESDSDNGAFDNEKHYAGTGRRPDNDADGGDDDDADDDNNDRPYGQHDESGARKKVAATTTTATASPPPPPTKQFVPESPSMPHIDDSASANASAVTTPTGCTPAAGCAFTATATTATATAAVSTTSTGSAAGAYDNSIASEPSEATTTCSDDATVISQLVEVIKELEVDRPEVNHILTKTLLRVLNSKA